MNINQILEQICKKDSIYDQMINTIIAPNYNQKPELISEIAISYLEHKDKIEEIYAKGYFKYYFIKTLTNQIHSKTSPFHKNTRVKDSEQNVSLDEIINETTIEDKIIFDEKVDKVNKAFSSIKKTWFDAQIWNHYFNENKSYRQIEEMYGVDHVAAFHHLKRLKERVIKEIKRGN